jgi:FMN phosphatase YigB (HAD superfamily)
VGDNPEADVVGAQQVGMKAVLRNIKREGLVYRQGITPDAAIDTLHDMLPILDTWYPGWR